ncbi:hypothetical protein [Gracilinema caldarium]|uniref:Uncharacterized protein n=1 Tax=Gracilinema caldarium (strain ATCC 51460 / DSM 7334 / H1) TaxID=744872 RepID=F8F1V9_GRAC1|nr:hypothetical protein [Gracilinema caldarium]AEJ19806.1 hypothetical protein Spica_1663 [Gracilinema caldarium DSM 7334]
MSLIVDLYALLEQQKPRPEHWALVDAFDAVTNGMDNPEALERIRSLDSIELNSWKWLIYAIKALYEGNASMVEQAIHHISEGTPPALLKPLFTTWLSKRLQRQNLYLDKPELADLFTQLSLPQHPLVNRAEQAEEALKQSFLPLFEQYFIKILRELYQIDTETGPGLAVRYGIHTLCLLYEGGYQLENVLPLLVQALGEADGCACLALAFIKLQTINQNLQERTLQALDACLAAPDGRFLNADMKCTLSIIKTFFNTSGIVDIIQIKLQNVRDPVQMELFNEELLWN